MITPVTTVGSQPTTALENFAARPGSSDEKKIAGVAREFEALLLRQVLSEARKPVITSSVLPNDQAGGIYDDMVNFQLAQAISTSGTLGLASQLERELGKQLRVGVPPAKS